ncbi:MAG: flagellin hook IN motif-containing protein [Candidatus Sericytochromatia bacterium]
MVNRITQQIMNRNMIGQIQSRQSDLFRTQRQINSGLRYERASEDPIAAGTAMSLQQAIAFQNRLETNSQLAQDFNNTAENEMASAEEVLQRVRELAIRAASEALNEQQLDGMSSELNSLLDRLGDIGNATHEGRYLFGGYQTQRPPFVLERHLDIGGSALNALGLNAGSLRTQVETRSLTAVQAGAFALNGGDLILNGVDIGSFVVNDPTRTAAENAETLVERINARSAETGVSARAVTLPSGSFDAPGGGPLTGIALSNRQPDGSTSDNGITVQGRGIPGLGGLPVLRNESLPLSDTRLRTEQVAAGALAPVPANTLQINGVNVTTPMAFLAGNTAEQNAQEIARAINSVASQSGVNATTDGYGFVQLISQQPFSIAGAPAQIEVPNGEFEQDRDSAASSAPVNAAGALRLESGSLILNGIDIFAEPLALDASLTAAQRAEAIAVAINRKDNDSGISARADSSGQLHFSNNDQKVTAVRYRGDSGDNLSQIGSNSTVPLYLSGDEAFAGSRRESLLVSAQDLPAAGLGSGVSTAPVSFQAGDSLTAGQFTLNGTDILVPAFSGTAATDANTLIAAINAQTGTTGVSAQLDGVAGVRLSSISGQLFSLQTSGTGQRAQIPSGSYLNPIEAGDFQINGVDIGPIAAVPANPGNPPQNMRDLGQALIDAINARAPLTGVSASLDTDATTGSTRLRLSSQGQDIRIDSADPLPASLFSATGLSSGTVVRQQVDVFQAVIDLRDRVQNAQSTRTGTQVISTQHLQEISDALDQVVSQRVELGVRSQRAALVENRVALNRELLEQQLAENREVDITAALSRLTLEETALQAAYRVAERINGLSLLNFI